MALATEVGLPNPQEIVRAYPHQLSGGQRQRAMIAMALALEPSVLVADEPTTALDVTTQAQILKLIRELQQRRGMSVMFITHDFGVVADIADEVAVLQRGRLVEAGPAAQVLHDPQAPYTKKLLAAVPTLNPPKREPLDGAPVALSISGLRKTYVTKARCSARPAWSTRPIPSPSTCAGAKPWGSWANPVPASRRRRASPSV